MSPRPQRLSYRSEAYESGPVSAYGQGLRHARSRMEDFVGVVLRPPMMAPWTNLPPKWEIFIFPTRRALDEWYAGTTAAPDHYLYVAAYDKQNQSWVTQPPMPVLEDTASDLGAVMEAVSRVSGSPDVGIEEIQMSAYEDFVGAAPSVADQLSHLDTLVRYHQLYWAHIAPEHPTMHAFLRDHWIPYFITYTRERQTLGPSGYLEVPDFIAAYIADEARKLSKLRELAAWNAIPTPDLGTTQHGVVSGDSAEVGHWFLPLALGLPAGAAGGYYYRKWQEAHPGKIIPWISGETNHDVGSLPWFSIIGADLDRETNARFWSQTNYKPGQKLNPKDPTDARMIRVWLDIHDKLRRDADAASAELSRRATALPSAIAAENHPAMASSTADATRRWAWPRTQLLIQSAIHNVLDWDQGHLSENKSEWERAKGTPVRAYVWRLESDPLGLSSSELFSTYDEALAYMRDAIHTDYAALALFDKMSAHWPNPVNWTKSDDPRVEDAITAQITHSAPLTPANKVAHAAQVAQAQRLARTTHAAGWTDSVGDLPWQTIIGDLPWWTIIGAEVDVFRRQAQAAAKEMPGRVVGLRRDAANQWQLESFRSVDAADNWFAVATAEPALFTYAAYFDKADPLFPHPLNEATGRGHTGGIAVSGIWDSISNAVLTITGTKMTNQFIHDHGLEPYVKFAGQAVATFYGGPAAGAAAGALAGPVMSLGVEDKAKATAAAQQVHGVTTTAQQHSPEMAQAVDVAHGALRKTATAYHVAHIVKAARRGDPAAQQALAKLNAAAAAGDSDAAAAVQLASMIDREQTKLSVPPIRRGIGEVAA